MKLQSQRFWPTILFSCLAFACGKETTSPIISNISPHQSVVTVSRYAVEAGQVATWQLRARDPQGRNVTQGGATVVFSISGGTSGGAVGPTVDHQDGIYSTTFTAQKAGSAVTVGAVVDGEPVRSILPALIVIPGPVSAMTSQVSLSQDAIALGGVTTASLEVRDAQGNPLQNPDLTVAFSVAGGSSQVTVGTTTYASDGLYSAPIRGNRAGTPLHVGAAIDGVAVTSDLPRLTVVGETSTLTSRVSVSADTIAVGAAATLTLTAYDAAGDRVPGGGLTVAFSATESSGANTGSIGPVTDAGDGTYFATFDSDATVGPTLVTIAATIDGRSVQSSPTPAIAVVPAAFSPHRSRISVERDTIASGESVKTHLAAFDVNGDAIDMGGFTVTFTLVAGAGLSTGTFQPAVDNLDGTYSATFVGVRAGVPAAIGAEIIVPGDTLVVTMDSAIVLDSLGGAIDSITVLPGGHSLDSSRVVLSRPTVDVGDTARIILQARDAAGNNIGHSVGVVEFLVLDSAGTSNGTIAPTPAADVGDGSYSALLTGTRAGIPVTIGATIGGAAVTDSLLPAITVVAVSTGVSVDSSEIVVNDSVLRSGTATTITLLSRDSLGNYLSAGGHTVVFQATGGMSTGSFTPATGGAVDHGDGRYSVTFTGLLAGSATRIGALIDSIDVRATAAITVTPGDVSAMESLVIVPPTSSGIDSGTVVPLTVETRDAARNRITVEGTCLTVIFTQTMTTGSSAGTISPTDACKRDGTYTANFMGTVVGQPTIIGAIIDGTPIMSPLPTIQVVAGTASPGRSEISVNGRPGASVTRTAGTVVNLELRAYDDTARALVGGGRQVIFTIFSNPGESGGSISPNPATDNKDGTYSATFVGITAGSPVTVGATLDGTRVTTPSSTIEVLPGSADSNLSIISVLDPSVMVGATTEVLLQARDAFGNDITTDVQSVVLMIVDSTAQGVGTLGITSFNSDGTYRATFNGSAPGTVTISANIDGFAVTSPRPTITVQ